jgi:hypothetical protein
LVGWWWEPAKWLGRVSLWVLFSRWGCGGRCGMGGRRQRRSSGGATAKGLVGYDRDHKARETVCHAESPPLGAFGERPDGRG